MRRALTLVRETKREYLHVSPPCGPWTSLQNDNQRNPQQIRRLTEQRLYSRRIMKNCCKLVEVQRSEGSRNAGCSEVQITESGHAGGKHPLRSSSWQLPEFRKMIRICGGERFTVRGCMHGLKESQTGRLHLKPWGWFQSMASIRAALEKHCDHPPGSHEQIQGGRRAAKTATYPYLLCRRFAKALMKEAYQGEVEERSRTPWISSSILARRSEEGAAPVEAPAEPESEDNPQGPQEDGEFVWDPEIKRKLTLVHRNLGHPNKQVLLRMLRDAGATAEVLRQAEHFDCPECRQRGRRLPTRPSTIPHYTRKWECMSIDTFWWHTPKAALQADQKPQHLLCLSMMDEACDFHAVHVVKCGENGPLLNMTGEEFNKKGFNLGWLKFLPAPQHLRYDEEGSLKRLDAITWLEGLGVKLEPTAGESPWQIAKHSKHTQTLKENMNLLCMERRNGVTPKSCRALLWVLRTTCIISVGTVPINGLSVNPPLELLPSSSSPDTCRTAVPETMRPSKRLCKMKRKHRSCFWRWTRKEEFNGRFAHKADPCVDLTVGGRKLPDMGVIGMGLLGCCVTKRRGAVVIIMLLGMLRDRRCV